MGIFSILPEWLAVVETWVARLCLVLAALTIGPWLLLLLYDLVLYICRTVQWELYGRYRGDSRPRAPSLRERPDGHRRQISFTGRDPADSSQEEAPTAAARAAFKLADS